MNFVELFKRVEVLEAKLKKYESEIEVKRIKKKLLKEDTILQVNEFITRCIVIMKKDERFEEIRHFTGVFQYETMFVKSKNYNSGIVFFKFIVTYFMHNHLGMSVSDLALWFNHNHTTIMNRIEKAEYDPLLMKVYNEVLFITPN